MSPDDFAELVVQTVESAMGPVLQRLVAAETKLALLWDVRDRVVTIEAKSNVPMPWVQRAELQGAVEELRKASTIDPAVIERHMRAAVDPLAQRLASLEAKAVTVATVDPSVEALIAKFEHGITSIKTSVEALAEPGRGTDALTVRVEALEAAQEPVLDLARFDGLSARINALPTAKDYADLRERVAVAESFARQQGPAGPAGPIGKDGINGRDGKDGNDGRDGKDGQAGRDGVDGKNGLDGLGFDEMSAEMTGDRTLSLTFTRGHLQKVFPLVLPFQFYRGVYTEEKEYLTGDVVTWGGSQWHCNERTSTKPGDGSKFWTLCVKKGRDGRDGIDAPGALPVVKVK